MDGEGSVYGGCNVESASYGLSVCAERVAVGHWHASRPQVAATASGSRLERVAVVAANAHGVLREFCYPCGACRQVLVEHAAPDAELLLVREASTSADHHGEGARPPSGPLCAWEAYEVLVTRLADTLPHAFAAPQLGAEDTAGTSR
eukprot:ctg_2874.g398